MSAEYIEGINSLLKKVLKEDEIEILPGLGEVLKPGDLITIGVDPGIDKFLVALNISESFVMEGKRCLLFQEAPTFEKAFAKKFAEIHKDAKNPSLRSLDKETLEALKYLRIYNDWVYLPEIEETLEVEEAKGIPAELLIIDFDDFSEKNSDTIERIKELTGKVPIILLTKLSRFHHFSYTLNHVLASRVVLKVLKSEEGITISLEQTKDVKAREINGEMRESGKIVLSST